MKPKLTPEEIELLDKFALGLAVAMVHSDDEHDADAVYDKAEAMIAERRKRLEGQRCQTLN